ncbi:AraC family transcriptional regulator [Pseudomaricurvus alcaniphilus]|uniref:helix-turn-helix domain-containing protein n=1 Tax=Pseudomaricurvus alcaniphilus TaxID=1166482 RepID=UPI001407E80E|nr:AraC family transcriptional regulator [Pseudomaricurvus alcaniphilus]NHN37351.1 AraC family transcriptional regulator [Pseudomaricurvus alcaniphilus]
MLMVSHKIDCEDFYQCAGVRQLLHVLDLIPDSLVWIKDSESRIIFANQYFLEQVGIDSLDLVIGLNDFDFAPRDIAEQFIADDKRVLQGAEVNERLELNVLKSGDLCWFLTSKRPIYDSNNRILGTYGISRHLEKISYSLKALDQLRVPIDYIRKYYMTQIQIQDLAAISHLSVSALERRFNKFLKKSPKRFINEIRLQNARRLLVETLVPISIVANESGFDDPAYFSRQFCKHFGESPSAYRERATSP